MHIAPTLSPHAKITGFREKSGRFLLGILIAVGLVVLFTPGMIFIAGWWNDPEYSHGWLIPFVTLFVLWQRRHRIVAAIGQGAWAGVWIFGGALLLYLFGSMALVQRIPFIALIFVLLGLSLAGLGKASTRFVWLPVIFLFFALPLPGSFHVPLSTSLQLISSSLGAGMLDLLGVSVLLDGNIIDLGIYQLQVAEACSGLRYLFPLAAFGFLCAWMFKGPLWARLLLFFSTVPITIVTNSARIALTGLFIEYGSIKMAEGFMHLFEGWIIFVVALAILFGEMWLLSRLAGSGGKLVGLLDFDRLSGSGIESRPAAPVSGPPRPLIACAVLLAATMAAKFAVSDRVQIIPDRPQLVTFPLRLDQWVGQTIPLDQSLLGRVGASDYLLADYSRAGAAAPVNLWVAYYQTQLDNAAIHSPKDCLPGGGWEYTSLDVVPAPTAAGADAFKLNRGVIVKGRERMVIYYWLEIRGRKLTNDALLKVFNLWDSFARRRSDGSLVRLITPVLPGEEVEDADRRLAGFLSQSYPTLETYIGD